MVAAGLRLSFIMTAPGIVNAVVVDLDFDMDFTLPEVRAIFEVVVSSKCRRSDWLTEEERIKLRLYIRKRMELSFFFFEVIH